MKKKIYKVLKKVFSNFWVRLIGLVAIIVGIFALAGAFKSLETLWTAIKDFITSGDTLSIIVVAAVSLIIASFALRGEKFLEESMKADDDHHKIICKYYGHEKTELRKNNYTSNGAFMYLSNLPSNRKAPRNPHKDKHSKDHKRRQEDIKAYVDGKLYLPNVNVYANIKGDTQVSIADTSDKFKLPRFVRDNALNLMEAHGHSNFSNNVTIRLNDVEVTNGNQLTLKTGRSQYFDMLITNRCMDYKLNDMLSIRDVYESGKTVSPLAESQLGNQIGINGLIFTKDGYLLVEKRGYHKTTWKNKFAQPISLAMKKSDIKCLKDNNPITDKDSVEDIFSDIILGTIEKNFGLTKDDIVEFNLSQNFLGIARDLLEGGKPNMYFYVTVNMTAQQLDKLLEDKAQKASKAPKDEINFPELSTDKLDSDYYLIRYKDFVIDYHYNLAVKARNIIFVKRLYAPRVSKIASATDGGYYRHKCRINGSIKRECGEALLACLSYVEACKDRLEKEITL